MMISTKGRYALRFLVDIAEHQAEGYVPLKDVAERQGISEKYLESIVKTLVRADVLTGLRGKGGGYRLRKSPDQYGVREILFLLEGPLVPVACLGPGDQSCDRMASCRTLPLWQGLEQVIQEYQIHHRRPHGPRRDRRVRLCDLTPYASSTTQKATPPTYWKSVRGGVVFLLLVLSTKAC